MRLPERLRRRRFGRAPSAEPRSIACALPHGLRADGAISARDLRRWRQATGKPADSQATIPPPSSYGGAKPCCSMYAVAVAERLPLRQYTA